MIHVWLYAGRVATVASYFTLTVAQPEAAGRIAPGFAGLALLVVAWDWWADR